MSITADELLRGCDAKFVGGCDVKFGEARDASNVMLDSITYNSTDVAPGSAFFCIEGFNVDGHKFARDAAARGAALIVAMHEVDLCGEAAAGCHDNDAGASAEISSAPALAIVPNTRMAMARAAANFYNNPSADMKLVGITGTNGKTTTSYITDHIITTSGINCGIIGTTGNRVGSVMEEAHNTTPESIDLQRLFARMRDAGDAAVVAEVSSHALDLYRPFGSHFAVTAFTNLTQDHLDFHKTFDDYFNAKAKLFSADYPARRVICIDDEWGRKLAEMCVQAGDNVLTCGFSRDANIYPVSVEYASDKTRVCLSVHTGGGEAEDHDTQIEIEYPLVGKFNVSNVMCAVGIALQLGISAPVIARALCDLPKVPGRLERFSAPGRASVFVDYAHTPDAIDKAIGSIKELNPARIICVFGCGGDRDAKKRPLMGAAALSAGFAVVTSDNPRTEDPDAIIEDILPGMSAGVRVEVDAEAGAPATSQDNKPQYVVIPDRKSAIEYAINMAGEHDAVLVAGKGHEDYQIIGTKKIHFDDREIVQAVLGECPNK